MPRHLAALAFVVLAASAPTVAQEPLPSDLSRAGSSAAPILAPSNSASDWSNREYSANDEYSVAERRVYLATKDLDRASQALVKKAAKGNGREVTVQADKVAKHARRLWLTLQNGKPSGTALSEESVKGTALLSKSADTADTIRLLVVQVIWGMKEEAHSGTYEARRAAILAELERINTLAVRVAAKSR